MQITGSITQPNISGNIKISHGEAYLPHDRGSGTAPFPRDISNRPKLPGGSYSRIAASKYVSRFLNLIPATSNILFHQPSGKFENNRNSSLNFFLICAVISSVRKQKLTEDHDFCG